MVFSERMSRRKFIATAIGGTAALFIPDNYDPRGSVSVIREGSLSEKEYGPVSPEQETRSLENLKRTVTLLYKPTFLDECTSGFKSIPPIKLLSLFDKTVYPDHALVVMQSRTSEIVHWPGEDLRNERYIIPTTIVNPELGELLSIEGDQVSMQIGITTKTTLDGELRGFQTWLTPDWIVQENKKQKEAFDKGEMLTSEQKNDEQMDQDILKVNQAIQMVFKYVPSDPEAWYADVQGGNPLFIYKYTKKETPTPEGTFLRFDYDDLGRMSTEGYLKG